MRAHSLAQAAVHCGPDLLGPLMKGYIDLLALLGESWLDASTAGFQVLGPKVPHELKQDG